MKLHRNAPNPEFWCGVPDCPRVAQEVRCIKIAHVQRSQVHHRYARDAQSQVQDTTLKCQVDFCQVTCGNLTQFLSHLKNHIQSGLEITCPFLACEKFLSEINICITCVSKSQKLFCQQSDRFCFGQWNVRFWPAWICIDMWKWKIRGLRGSYS